MVRERRYYAYIMASKGRVVYVGCPERGGRNKSPCAVNLHNAVTLSQRSARMNEVCATPRFSLGWDAN
jgi:hypothetical protein